MIRRPLSVTVIGWLFIAAGCVGIAYHASKFNSDSPFQYDVIWVLLVRLLAVVCGVFMLRGSNWARWGLVVWLAYHVILSGFHSVTELIMHSLLLAVIAYFLFRPRATEFFRRGSGDTVQPPN
jgi:hypothetical protein